MANPTTNYGFVLPTSTDLVTDLPADFDVALQGVDTRLKALQPGTTLGDLAYSSATANTNTRLGIGSNAQVLTVAGGVPTWATPAGVSGSTIKQIVTGSTTTSTVIASTTLTDTTLTATITPTSASSTILVLITQQFAVSRSSTNIGAKYKVFRGATTIVDYSAAANNYAEIDLSGTVTAAKLLTNHSISYLDSPASTSALVYKTQGACNNTADSGRVTFQIGSAPSLITLIEIG